MSSHLGEKEKLYGYNSTYARIDQVLNGQIDLIVNSPLGRESFFDDLAVRRVAMLHSVPCITTLTGAVATVSAIRALRSETIRVRPLQDYHAETLTDRA